MAQPTVYKPFGALEVMPDEVYTGANLPGTADIIVLLMGTRLKDKDGNLTPLRGAYVTITATGVAAASSPLPNVPFLILEGAELRFDAAYSYKFHTHGIIGYGIAVAV